jgi:USP8 dimerisation domain
MSAPTVGSSSSSPSSSSSSSSPRPSDERRRQLNQELSIPLVSNFFPIERYYNAADKVYESFEDVRAKGMLDDAYVYGKRYCLFCVDAIPTHNYYHSPKYAAYKTLSVKRVNAVIRALEQIVVQMDREEQEKERQRLERERIVAEQQAKERQDRLDRFQQSFEQKRRGTAAADSSSSTTPKGDVQASALSKLQRLNGGPVVGQQNSEEVLSLRRDPSGEAPMPTTTQSSSSCRYRILDESDDELASTSAALPPPIPPPALSSNGGGAALPPPPPSYDQIRTGGRDFLGLAAKGPASAAAAASSPAASTAKTKQQRRQQQQQQPQLPMRSLLERHRTEYLTLADKGHISVSCLNTYQGRVHESTNGCTVISALVAANHMIKRDTGTVTNDEITHIIDNVCGPVLRKIRSKLGLPAHALLIPSDVHDQLVDDKVLSQDCFEGASGGSVLDEDHMGEFLKLLSVGESGTGAHSKAAATFFFREHVISIVKYHHGSNRQVWYDLIDSMPANIQGRSAATRTRCASLEALKTLLNWYCSRKFSEANCRYIDSNKWDDNLADFDPRVFQGFVWMTKQQ